jgi:CO/xanthine dehydrogenase Mo-binding subunit
MMQVVGKPTARVEGELKVTGKAQYSADVRLPNLLWGRCLRSPISYGPIKSVDIDKALRVPGVKAVIAASGHSSIAFAPEGLRPDRQSVRRLLGGVNKPG